MFVKKTKKWTGFFVESFVDSAQIKKLDGILCGILCRICPKKFFNTPWGREAPAAVGGGALKTDIIIIRIDIMIGGNAEKKKWVINLMKVKTHSIYRIPKNQLLKKY